MLVFDRLQTRIVLLFAILFVVVQGLTSFAVYRATTTNIDDQITEQLNYSAAMVQQSLANDINQLADGTRLLSSDFGFRTAVATNDYPTILSALENLVNRIDANSAFLISLDEEIIADTAEQAPENIKAFSYPNLIEIADIDGQAATFINEGGKSYEIVLMPVLAPITVAWIGIRLEMDNEKAQSIKEILPQGIDISFILRDEQAQGQWRLIASTLSNNFIGEIAEKINIGESISEAAAPITLNNREFIALSVDFPTLLQSANVRAILQYSLDVAYSPYQPLIISLALLIAFGLVALVLGSLFTSKSVTRPISALADSARAISEGNYSPVPETGRQDEVHHLATGFNAMIESIRQREAKIIHQAEHDLTTGLPNRIGLERHLKAMITAVQENGEQFSVLEISLDHFHNIRNAIGFSISENLIKQIGPRLSSLTRECDLITCTGSSTFIMTLPGISTEKANTICQRIIKGFEQPFKIDSVTIDVLVNIGAVNYPEHGNTVEVILQRVNIACFQSESLVSHIAAYDAKKDQHDADKLSLMSELRKALESDKGEIEFLYQPKIDLSLGSVNHAEALIRWTHPERGPISPDDFIPLAEKTGDIHHITRWALEQGIQQAGKWHHAGKNIKLAINLSAKDLSNKELPSIITTALEKYEVSANCLVMEVTEGAVMEDPESALSILNELNDMGLTLSIDDYGTGYSSMAYLKRLPVQEIKIDRSFVQHLAQNSDDEIIVRSTIELGHNLGLKVTAEGVEDASALEILRKLNCDMAQGYFFAKPLSVKEFDDFLQSFTFDLVNSDDIPSTGT